MQITIRRYDDDCGEISPGIQGTASNINFPLYENDSFEIFIADGNGIPVHGGTTCIYFDDEKISEEYPFGVQVSIGSAKPDQGHGIEYDVTVLAL